MTTSEQKDTQPWLEECLSVPRLKLRVAGIQRLSVRGTFEKWSFNGRKRDFD